MPDTTSKVITIARGVETNDPAMADVEAMAGSDARTRRGSEGNLKQQRAARKAKRINRHNLNLARRTGELISKD